MKSKTNYNDWKNKAQPGELAFHKHCKPRADGTFRRDSDLLLSSLYFNPNEFDGMVILDAGAGSLLRTKFFSGAYLIAIEPLAVEFMGIDWSDLTTANELYPTPLEEFIPELVGKVDFIFSVNVLDHCFDFDLCIANLSKYLAPGGRMFISFDEHKNSDPLHPLSLVKSDCDKCFENNNLRIEKFLPGDVYGFGNRSLNYWLRNEEDGN